MNNNHWVKCFSVVTFDEDLGQKVEFQTPEIMNESQQQALAYLAFPDSNSFNTMGNLVYVFKMKLETVLFGYVYFRQKRDISKPRKFFQKSLVLISELPYISLFRQVVEIVGSLYFDHGDSIFEAANSCLKTWGESVPGNSLELPMLGSVINFTTPSTENSFSPQFIGDGLSEILDNINLGYPGLFQDINIIDTVGMHFVKNYLWSFWEIIICGEGLLVLTDSPETCSLGILAAISLISPLIYTGDYYPYLTIFDPDFKNIETRCEKKRLNDIIIGATNPFILKLLSNSPNVFQFEQRNGLRCIHMVSSSNCLSPCKAITTRFFKGKSKETTAINNSALRKHFRELTLTFLQPFQQYLTMDIKKILESPYSQLNSLKPFTEQEFLSDLNNSKTLFPLLKFTTRPKAISIYSKFLKTSTFTRWFASERQKANGESDKIIRNAMFNFDISKVFNLEKRERRLLYEKIKGRLMYEESIAENDEGVYKLKAQLDLLGKNIAKLNETI